jgi:hypothetical protein
MDITIEPLGDLAIRVCFGEGISERIHKRIHQFTSMLDVSKIHGIVEWVPDTLIRFTEVSLDEAQSLYFKRRSLLKRLALAAK